MAGLIPRSTGPWLALWLTAVLVGAAVVGMVTGRTASGHLVRHAEAAALNYAQALGSAVPAIPRLMAGAPLDAPTLDELRRLTTLGEVFRFKLFDRRGRQLLVSDDLPQLRAGEALRPRTGVNVHAVADGVLAGRSHIELKDGTGRTDRPEVYSEAYVPLMVGGEVVGVIEVYVDQVARRDAIHGDFAKVGASVAVVLLALGGLGVWQLARRARAQLAAEDRVRYLAQHDPLSGALNRASFNDALKRAARQTEAGAPAFAVLCIDLDRFKEVNDSLGHGAGDEVLRQVTQRLQVLVRQGDHVARLGGDEFVLLQSGVGSADDVRILAQRVVDRLAEPIDLGSQRTTIGASVGCAIWGTDARSIDELMHKADLALYRAKSEGRGCFSFYDAELDRRLHQRRELVRDLREAVRQESLTLHYQPLYSSDAEVVTGYEALLRWQHPTRGPVSPAEFIPLAEDHGLIDTLGAWVLQRACRDAAGWPGATTVSVNLSAAQFKSGRLVETVRHALRSAGLSAERLELEITESLLMSDTDQVVGTLHQLSALGVKIAMDDFGTGYSSLAYLWKFPFDKVKIDRAFTKGLGEDPKVTLIVRSIVSLAHALQIRVNAEGVETAAQLRALQKHGCDEVQGFLLGRPGPVAGLRHERAAATAPERPGPSATDLQDLPTMPLPL